MGRRFASTDTSAFGWISEGDANEADLFFEELTGHPAHLRAAEAVAAEEPEPLAPGFLRWSPGFRGDFPPRPSGAMGGRVFMRTIAGTTSPTGQAWLDREAAIVQELLAGNMPDALLRWVDVDLPPVSRGGTSGRAPPPLSPGGSMIRGTVQVLPDYLSVGSDGDFVHVPLDPVSAQYVADELNAILPTARVCHAVYLSLRAAPAQRIGRIARDYYQPDALRRHAPRGQTQDSTAAYLEHSEAIQNKMRATGIGLGTLVAGHKKDVVISPRLHATPDRIAFHGFYDEDGFPMEPCYENRERQPQPRCRRDMPALAHRRRFSDYSQGIRLMSKKMIVDGRQLAVADVLADAELSWLLSSEGPITSARIPAEPIRRRPVKKGENFSLEETPAASGVTIEPAVALGASRTTSPIATVSPQRQLNELLDRELVLIAQGRVFAEWIAKRFSATIEQALADASLMSGLDRSRDRELQRRLRPFPARRLPDRREQLFTTDAELGRLLGPPRRAEDLHPILHMLKHYGVVMLPHGGVGHPPVQDIVALVTRVEARIERARFDTTAGLIERFAETFKVGVAEDKRRIVVTDTIPATWRSDKNARLIFATSVVTLLGRLRALNETWTAGTYPRHWWNEFSVDVFLVAGRTHEGFYTLATVRAFFEALDSACRDTAEPGPYAWKAIYNDAGLAAEINQRFGAGRVLSGVPGHGPGANMHIHLDLRPLRVMLDEATGFRIDQGRVVLTSPPTARAQETVARQERRMGRPLQSATLLGSGWIYPPTPHAEFFPEVTTRSTGRNSWRGRISARERQNTEAFYRDLMGISRFGRHEGDEWSLASKVDYFSEAKPDNLVSHNFLGNKVEVSPEMQPPAPGQPAPTVVTLPTPGQPTPAVTAPPPTFDQPAPTTIPPPPPFDQPEPTVIGQPPRYDVPTTDMPTTDIPVADVPLTDMPAGGMPVTEDEIAFAHIDASRLSWPAASAQQLDLMRRVYLGQVGRSGRTRTFVGDVPRAELAEIEQGFQLRRPAAEACRRLLADARTAAAGDPAAANVSRIGLVSGYRPATQQLAIWNRNFPRYYQETRADRQALDGGEFGSAATQLLIGYVSGRLAAPGFSLHNNGLAVDFVTEQGRVSMGADSSARNRSRWRGCWFFRWLSDNANGYGFFQNTAIDEPWHWEFRDPGSTAREIAFTPDTVEPTDAVPAAELTIAAGRAEFSRTPLLASHRGTQPDLILRWNDMADPAAIDVVVHLHGHSSDKDSMSLRRKEAYSGLDFGNPDDPADPRGGRTAPTLCLLPRGSYTPGPPRPNPERYSFPALTGPSGIRDLIAYGLGQFQSASGAPSGLSAGRTILTAHSGGGDYLMPALAHNSPDEIHLFDGLYSDAAPLIAWVRRRITSEIAGWTVGKTRADGGLCVLYRGGTATQSRRVASAIGQGIAAAPADAQPILQAAYRVLRTTVEHGEIPRRYGWLLLADVTSGLGTAAQHESEPEEADFGEAKPDNLVSHNFLGNEVEVSPEMQRRLSTAQDSIQAAFDALDPNHPDRVQYGGGQKTLREWAGIMSARGWQDRPGRHGSGSAVDLNYELQPYIVTRSQKKGRTVLGGEAAGAKLVRERQHAADVYDRAVRFVSAQPNAMTLVAPVHSRLRGESTADAYTRLSSVSQAMNRYFRYALLEDLTEINRRPIANIEAATEDQLLTSIPLTERRDAARAIGDLEALMGTTFNTGWAANHGGWDLSPRQTYFRMLRDYEHMRIPMVKGTPEARPPVTRNPALGFLHMKREVVVALADVGRLRWGAIDFGPDESGDVHHFDIP